VGIFDKLFSGTQQKSVQHDPKVHHLADEASRVADEMIKREYVGRSILMSSINEMGSESPLTKAVDRVLELAADDPDFLFAKSEAHAARMDGKTSLEYLRKTLAVAPDHYDAKMRQNHSEQWDNIFAYPSWSEQNKKVPAMMLALQSEGNFVQIVRDGLILTLAILIPASQNQFSSNILESRWKPLWVETPHGPVFVHYAMLKLQSGTIYKQEMTISPYPIEPLHPRTGHWLIRRFCEVNSIFIGFNNEGDVFYNKRYTFPKPLRSSLGSVKSKLKNLTLPHDYNNKYQLAVQWYMQNSNLDGIAWN
jgi:hypothetical protein